jgi:hypothetical protein
VRIRRRDRCDHLPRCGRGWTWWIEKLYPDQKLRFN